MRQNKPDIRLAESDAGEEKIHACSRDDDWNDHRRQQNNHYCRSTGHVAFR